MFTKKCFVLMPFDPNLTALYSRVYKPVCEANGIRCQRVDEIRKPGSIPQDIFEGILDADIIISDITLYNPNVMYELGFAHTVGKPTIITAQHGKELPFDISTQRVFFYEQSDESISNLFGILDSAIKAILEVSTLTNTPTYDVVRKRASILQDLNKPLLNKSRIMQLIRLHRLSTAYLIYSVIDGILYRMRTSTEHYNPETLTVGIYAKILESKKLCAGFRGRVIGDIYEFLLERFDEEKLREIVERVGEKLSENVSDDVKRANAIIYIQAEEDKILTKIEQEIDEKEN